MGGIEKTNLEIKAGVGGGGGEGESSKKPGNAVTEYQPSSDVTKLSKPRLTTAKN